MLARKFLRTALKYKAQFISMIIMLTIGVGVFLAFNIEWASIEKNTNDFFASTNFADFRIYSETGFTKDDIEKVKALDGVDGATRCLVYDVACDDGNSLALNVVEDYGISALLVTEGAQYDEKSEGAWLSDRYAEANSVSVGDSIKLTFGGLSLDVKVEGLVKSAEYLICVADANQIMPDYSVYGFAYVTPALMAKTPFGGLYTQINVKSDLEKTVLEDELSEALEKTLLVLSIEENAGYIGAHGEIDEGKTMGTIIPVLFLLIAVLTMVTTMHRVAANEKLQIGTLKALGFKDRRILIHYSLYGLALGICGCVLGTGIGYALAYLIINPSGMMATYLDMPSWSLHLPWFGAPVLIAVALLITLIGFLSVKRMLSGTAADALRPYTPKKVKAGILEKTAVWEKLPFSTRWNVRDLTRHKARSAMTFIGVLGCVLIICATLGMRDTVNLFMDRLESGNNYVTRVTVSADGGAEELNEKAEALAEKYGGDWLAESSVKYNDKAIALDIYSLENGKIKLYDDKGKETAISDDGAYVCVRIADGGAKVGDTLEISPYGANSTYSVKVAGVISSLNTESIVMTKTYAEKCGIPYRISSVYVDELPENMPETQDSLVFTGTQAKENIILSYDSFMETMNTMVIILVAGGAVLGVVVLYNLGVMSYIERSREMATLKVVGFKDRQIGKILVSQNIYLTILGIIIGLPTGYGVLLVLIKALASEYEMTAAITALSYIITTVATLVLSFLVGLAVARKNKKIDMTESLKDA